MADLIWLFEDEPTSEYDDVTWPVGLQGFRLRRGAREVLFSLDVCRCAGRKARANRATAS
ncbi:hypothetical protein [Actinomadura geliboluensis]